MNPGLQLPNNLKRLDSDIILHRFGENVKPQSKKSFDSDTKYELSETDSEGKRLSEGQKAFFADSRIRITPTEEWHDTIND